MNRLNITTAVTCASLLASGPAGAEAISALKDKLGQFSADLAMPSTAAAVHVGLSAETVIQPKNRREFEGAVSGLLKDGGKPAGAIEFLPYYIAMGGKLPFRRYENNGAFRALTRVSLGAAAGTREIGDSQVKVSANGLSLSTVLVDLSDPIHSFGLQDCINKVQSVALEEARAAGSGAATPLPAAGSTAALSADDVVVTPKADAAYGACLKSFRSTTQLWNRSKVSLGVAGGNGHEQSGEKRKVHYGTATWLTVQYGFEGLGKLSNALFGKVYLDCSNLDVTPDKPASCTPVAEDHWRDRSQLTLHARHVRRASDLDLSQTGTLADVSSRLFGGRFTYGSERRNFFVEFSRLAERRTLNGRSSTNQRAFGASVKVMDNLWLNLVSGRRKEVTGNGTINVVRVDLAYGLSQDSLVPSP
jgi:hypothetical protein